MYISPRSLFVLTFISMVTVYLYVFGHEKTVEIIKAEYLMFLALIPLSFISIFFKIKLKDYQLTNFNRNSNLSFKTTVLFFLAFQVYDYISYDGFEGMISQWILYWVMGLIALLLIENINFYKNYKLIYKNS